MNMPHHQIIGSLDRPLIGNIPHSSTIIPPALRAAILLDEQRLADELRVMTDSYTDELFAAIAKNGGVNLVAQFSRLVVDVERFTDDAVEPMAKVGMGAIYEKTHDLQELRRRLNSQERATYLDEFYHPYHQTLTELCSKSLAKFGRCLIVDCHSFASTPLPYEPNQATERPDICLGVDDFHTPAELVEKTRHHFADHGLRVGINQPFSGSLVPLDFYRREKRVSSIMIEVNRRLYLDEVSGEKNGSFAKICEVIEGFCEHLIN